MSRLKQFQKIILFFFTVMILLLSSVWAQQLESIESSSWILKPQNKKEDFIGIVIFFLKNHEACVMFQSSKGSDLGLLPVRIDKRPIWKLNSADYSIKFRDRDFAISGKILSGDSITAVTKGEDNLLENKSGFIGESLKDPKPTYNSRNFLVPLPWLTALPGGKLKWAPEIKTQGLDLCNPLGDPNNRSPWFPPS